MLAVVDRRADLTIFAERTATLGPQKQPYRRDQLALVVPAGHALPRRPACGPIDFAAATDFDFVSLPPETSLTQRLAKESSALGRHLRVRTHVRRFDTIYRMVAAGLGIAVLPQTAVQPHLGSMGLVSLALSDGWAARRLLLGARDLGALARPARLLLEHLRGPAA